MAQQSDEQRREFEAEAVRIVELAAGRGLTLRVLGSLAFHLQCPRYGHLQKTLGRAYTDIDFAGYSQQASPVGEFFLSLGYREEPEVNLLFAGQRLIYHHPTMAGVHVDVFSTAELLPRNRWVAAWRRGPDPALADAAGKMQLRINEISSTRLCCSWVLQPR
jgi:hypothetical protein